MYYNGYRIQFPLEACNLNYLRIVDAVITQSVSMSTRVAVFRFDLRFPNWMLDFPEKVITKFFESLKAQLRAKEKRDVAMGKRVYPHNLNFIWVRERSVSHSDHFHCVIFLNKDAYSILGDFNKWRGNLAARIKLAWMSAIGAQGVPVDGLVHFSENGTYFLDLNSDDFFVQRADLFYRLSYFAKHDTKCYGDGGRCIGTSRISRVF